ncbi:MAG: InlB B-repeat-containing protein, partial [Lachnospiraceae bacterium]|nr:InlB B-repeat-containing protein [Lachnospiraceae bacterium]
NRYTALPTAERAGYLFKGWYTAAEGGTKITENSGVAATDRTLYAHWTARTYTVKFDANGGTCETKSQKYVYGPTNRYTALPTAERAGYLFKGWYTAAEGGTKITENSGVAATDRTLYAHWTAKTYVTKFSGNGGTSTKSSVTLKYGIQYGNVLTDITATKKGYTFIGWYTAADGGSKVASTEYIPAEDRTLYAHWTENIYTITYNANGGVCNTESQKYTYGSNNKYTALPTATRTGYTFVGWYTAEEGGTKITTDTGVAATDRILYAHWKAKTYVTKFKGNGGTSTKSSVTLKYGIQYGNVLTDITATRTGYLFDGWYTAAEGGNKVASTDYIQAEDRTLYAHWTAKTYTVTFNANGGKCDTKTQQYTYGSSNKYTALPTATRTGYTFTGWYTDIDEGTKITKYTGVAASDRTLYAHWTAKTYTVKFNANGGICDIESQQYVYGPTNRYTALPTPTRDGYVFEGWYTAVDGGTKIKDNTGVAATNRTFYAHWKKRTVISFDSTEGNCEIRSEYFISGEPFGTRLIEIVPVREGYDFYGWYKTAIGYKHDIYEVNCTDLVPEEECTLYARWEVTGNCKVIFDANGGNLSITEDTYKKGEKYGNLPTPGKVGCVFEGWYTSKTGGTKVTSESFVPNEVKKTLYAHWKELKLCYNNNSYNMDVEDNMVINCLGYSQELVFTVNSDVNIIKVYSSADWIDENFVFNNESNVLHIFINANRYDKREAEIKVFADNGTWKKFNISQGAVDKFVNANYEDYIFGSNKENGITLGSYFEKAETCGGDVDGLFTPNHNGIIKVCTDHFLYYETYFTGMCFYTDWILVNCTDKKGVNWCYDDSGKKIGKYGYEWDDILEVDMQVELERTNAVNSSVAARFVTGLQKGNDILLKTDVNGSAHLEKDSDYYSLFKNSYKTYKSLVSVASVLSGNPGSIIMSTVDLAVNGVELVGWIGDQEEYTIEHDGKPRLYKSYYVDAEGENNSRVQNPDDLSINAVKFGMDYTSGYKLKKEGDQYNVDFIYCNAGLNNYKGNNEMAGAYAENGIENSLYTVYIIEFEINDKMAMYYDVYGFEDSEKWKSDKDPSKIEGKMGFIPTISANSFYKTGKLYLRKPAPNT